MTTIRKADGSNEPFKREKLISSLSRAGADGRLAEEITTEIEETLEAGMTTERIYRRAHGLLAKHTKTAAGRYGLRRALFDLGPTGFPFERFLAELFEAEGYTVEVGVPAQGECAQHEVDLLTHRGDTCLIAEAKFHTRHGLRSDLQVALSAYARFLDLKGKRVGNAPCGVGEGWLITNTKFTQVAVDYAACAGLSLLSWGYPEGASLRERIEAAKLYPVTTLPSVSAREKRLLLENNLVLCRDMVGKQSELERTGLPEKRIETIIEESVKLCSVS